MKFQHSIKAKTLCVIAVVFLLQAFFSTRSILDTYEEYRRMRLTQVRQSFELQCQSLNKHVLLLQKSVLQLGVQAEMYLNLPQQWRPSGVAFAKKVLEETPEAVGCGLWSEPYLDSPKKRLSCAYISRATGQLQLDPSYESEAYDYLTQMWYVFVKEHSRQWLGIIWTPPYVDTNSSGKILMATLAYPLYTSGRFMGMATLDWELSNIVKRVVQLEPTKGSFSLFADLYHDVILVDTSQEGGGLGRSVQSIPWLKHVGVGQRRFQYEGVTHVAFMETLDNDMALVLVVPEDELYAPVRRNLYDMLMWLAVSTLFLLGITWYLLQHFISRPVQIIADRAQAIGHGDLDVRIPVSDKGELGALAHVLNTMTENLQKHMSAMYSLTQEKERIAAELNVATRIQTAMLPCIFPAFPDKKEFDLYASMRPAREVGGDFYDFFFVDARHLALIIADVSGKGVPAALFMVIAKTLLRNHMQGGLLPSDALAATNKQLCENNNMNMFVTVWAGLLTLESGHLRYSNAGHNKPLWSHEGSAYSVLESRRGFVLGGMEGILYTDEHCTLAPGDRLLLYTDGITEAENSGAVQFGVQRLLECVDDSRALPLQSGATVLMKAVDDFAQDVPQTDDITLLMLEYRGQEGVADTAGGVTEPMCARPHEGLSPESWKGRVPADTTRFPALRDRLEVMLARHHCPAKASYHLLLALEEVFVNIAHYAYPDGQGDVRVEFNIQTVTSDHTACASPEAGGEASAVLRFQDKGRAFNPLDHASPDLTIPTEDRQEGGLGIHMLHKMMDSLEYMRKDGENILTLTKLWRTPLPCGSAEAGEKTCTLKKN